MSYVISWSGGKDCNYALLLAKQRGLKISHLLNFISHESKTVIHHGTPSRLIQMQSEALGIPLLQVETAWGVTEYETQFKGALKNLIANGLEGVIFSTIKWQGHWDWEKRICDELGLKVIHPLWGMVTEDVVTKIIESGIKAIVVSGKSDLIDIEWIGHLVNLDFVDYLKAKGLDPCGENSEYHSFVTDSPIYKRRICLTPGNVTINNEYWIMDTQDTNF